MKYFLFIDESGDHGLVSVDPNFPVFILCGIIVSEQEYQEIINKMDNIKKMFWGNKTVIFHSRDIRKCEKEFQILFDLDIKRRFYDAVNKLVQTTNYVIITSAIKKDDYINRYGKLVSDVYEIALSFILERSIFLLDDRPDKPHQLNIVVERRGKREDKSLHEHFQKLASRGTAYITPNRIRNYSMNISFKSKYEDISGLQLADLIAYPVARYVIDPDRANPAFDILRSKIYEKRKKMYGLKVFP